MGARLDPGRAGAGAGAGTGRLRGVPPPPALDLADAERSDGGTRGAEQGLPTRRGSRRVRGLSRVAGAKRRRRQAERAEEIPSPRTPGSGGINIGGGEAFWTKGGKPLLGVIMKLFTFLKWGAETDLTRVSIKEKRRFHKIPVVLVHGSPRSF